MPIASTRYRWEDGPHLQHHCGFCDRPLAHRGAMSTCFGTHSEPCWRFHQVMFMRGRGHTCSMCQSIEEAHAKRHMEIAQGLLAIYEMTGSGMSIIPDDEQGQQDHESKSALSISEALTKRERKDQKRLARAANRPNLITMEDRQYVGDVLHSVKYEPNASEPDNLEEIAEIEKHLLYKGYAYAKALKLKSNLSKFAKYPCDEIDFEKEIPRILDRFRITELLNHNKKNKGLLGKDLKDFENAVAILKQAVVDDLVLLKKDELEIRMRRAAYLRYTSRAAFEVVLDRYSGKDWKTGEKFSDLGKEASSSDASLGEKEPHGHPEDEDDGKIDQCDNLTPLKRPSKPDNRHLTMNYRVLGNPDTPHNATSNPWLHRSPENSTNQLEMTKGPVVLAIRPREQHNVEVTSSHKGPQSCGLKGGSLPRIPPLCSMENETPDIKATQDRNVQSRLKPPFSPPVPPMPTETAALTSTKKKDKKKQRELQRKARRAAEKNGGQEAEDSIITCDENSNDMALEVQSDVSKLLGEQEDEETHPVTDQILQFIQPEGQRNEERLTIHNHKLANMVSPVLSDLPSSEKSMSYVTALSSPCSFYSLESFDDIQDALELSPIPVVENTRWSDWMKFTDEFLVDGLSQPFHHCIFDATQTMDCPMHTHNSYCICHSPEAEQYYIVYPRNGTSQIGPMNQYRALKLLAYFQSQPRLTSKLTMMHSSIMAWAEADAISRTLAQPPALKAEIDEWNANPHREPGLLMTQIDLYRSLRSRNRLMPNKEHVTTEELNRYCKKCEDGPEHLRICYCASYLPENFNPDDYITCSYKFCNLKFFHRECVRTSGVGPSVSSKNGSVWYCFDCDYMISRVAKRVVEEINGVRDRDCEAFHPAKYIECLPQLTAPVRESLKRMMEERGLTLSSEMDVTIKVVG